MDPLSADRQFARDIYDLRVEFTAVNVRDAASLKAWFLEHSYLTDVEHATVARCSVRNIWKWKTKLDLKKPSKHKMPALTEKMVRRRRVLPPAPDDWRTNGWLTEQYSVNRYSIREMMRAAGITYLAMWLHLKKGGLLARTSAEALTPKNPCCNKVWLVEHYVTQFKSVFECAKLAGVSRQTMANWLVRFLIRVRTHAEQIRYGTNMGKGFNSEAKPVRRSIHGLSSTRQTRNVDVQRPGGDVSIQGGAEIQMPDQGLGNLGTANTNK